MEVLVANTDHIMFDIEKALEQQLGALPLPFPGMDKSGSAICSFFLKSTCSKGANCPFRHVQGEKSVVCKHWLRGLCKKGDFCEFLHEYDMLKMPECYFYSRFGECGNKECPFLHIDPEQKMKVCPWYDRGFCRHGLYYGAACKNRHVRRIICTNYVCGFCLDGPQCKFVHPSFDIPYDNATAQLRKQTVYTCHYCGEMGHKAVTCPKLPAPGSRRVNPEPLANVNTNVPGPVIPGARMPRPFGKQELRPLEEVTCFKCGEKGHYANKCPKGHLAFLSNKAQNIQQQQQLFQQHQQQRMQQQPQQQQQQQQLVKQDFIPTVSNNGT